MSDTSYFVAGPSSQPYSSEARQSLFSVVAAIAKGQGYDGIDSSAMDYILNRLESLLFSLPAHAHQLAVMANRRVPSTRDLYAAIQHSGPRLRPDELEQYLRDVDLEDLDWRKETNGILAKPAWRDPFDGLLPSESEDDSAPEREEEKESGIVSTRSKAAKNAPARKRRRKKFKVEMVEVPSHLPALPPKHTWLSSPSYPAHSINLQPPLAFLDVKVSSNRLMESSLRGLIRATDAAVLDSQAQRNAIESGNVGNDVQFDVEVFGSAKGATNEQSADSPRSSVLYNGIGSGSPNTTRVNEANEKESQLRRLKKGRTLSLRLRAPSVSQANPQVVAVNTPEVPQSPAPHKPTGISHRPSLSLAGSQSAILPTFASHLRRNTYASGPWSATTNQSQFNWNIPPTSDVMSPLATPLTPGWGYNYPSTPSDAYANEILSKEAGQKLEQSGSAIIGLPPTVNYKRTWYKKSNSTATNTSTNAIAAQKRIKS